jgi:hypothetical protein
MEFKGFMKKILAIAAILLITSGISFAAKSPEMTVPHQYPAKYTPEYIKQITPNYKDVGKDEVFYVALDMLKETEGMFSRNAILGNNLSQRPMKIEFRDLGQINQNYASFDALGWKKGKNLYIYISNRHKEAPAGAIAALLSHEALHQDEFNSLAEETYAWTMEAVVWDDILKVYPESNQESSALVKRENTLKKLLEKGRQAGKPGQYIKKAVMQNSGYKNLPSYSPGFDKL